MSAEKNKNIARRYYQEIAGEPNLKKSLAIVEDLLAPDFAFYYGSEEIGVLGIDNHKQFLEQHHKVSPDQRWIIERFIAEDEAVATVFTLTGTHQDEFGGISATGRTFKVRGMDYFYIIDGRIKEIIRIFDSLDLLEQLQGNVDRSIR